LASRTYSKEERIGFVGTILFHIFLFILFLILGLKSIDPPPDSGVLLNFGTSEFGSGDIQPEEAVATPVEPENPDVVDAAPEKPEIVEEEVITQDAVETVEVPKEKPKEEPKEEKPEISDELKQTLSNAFNKKKNSGSEGPDNQAGDKGSTEGTKDGKDYTGDPGGGGNGISYNLGGRRHLSLPKPIDNSQDEGTVVVSIIVDRNGNVISAQPGARGSTTTNANLLKKAKEAALKAKFSANPTAPEEQKGSITYKFLLQ
jgi:periplasmic protein TonB